MGFEVTIVVPCNGSIERVPTGIDRKDVLGTQGQILESTCGNCQLFWSLSSAYLSLQVNALCSFLSGQLVRGDALLTASLSSPGQAQAWVTSVMKKSRALQASREPSDLTASPENNAPTPNKQGPQCSRKSMAFSQASSQSSKLSSPWEMYSNVPALEECSNSNPTSQRQAAPETARGDVRTAHPVMEVHTALAVPDDSSEPRTRLLWSIVGQASSVDWKDRPKNARVKLAAEDGCSQPNFEPIATSQNELRGATAVQFATQSHEVQRESKPSSDPREELENAQSCPSERDELAEKQHWDDFHSHHTFDWADFQPELLSIVASKCRSAAPLQHMVSTCRSWRSVILSDSQLLQTLKFSEAQAPLALMRQYSEGQACPVGTGLPVTNLIDKAAKAGNLGACVAIANFIDNIGLREEGMRYRRRAAKLGDLHSQVTIGIAAYSGTSGIIRDSDEAYRWLSRAANKLAKLPFSLSTGHLLSRAALHLGFLALDGEATKLDLEGAVSWFRLASKCGSRDAEIALGTLIRTGQYG